MSRQAMALLGDTLVSHTPGAAPAGCALVSRALEAIHHASCDPVSAINPIVGFGVDDHRIRELMRFAEITSREYSKEVVEYHGGSLIF